jgi:hypothetical protein
MPGPFPGMDPYLEKRTFWQGAHNKLLTFMETALNATLPSPYVANTETRCYIERLPETIIPDLAVSQAAQLEAVPSSSGVLVREPYSPSVYFKVHELEIEEAYIDVLNLEDNRRIIASIELLSHTNKTTRDKGRERYLEKQRRVLHSTAHLLEIDLLRAGRHTVAIAPSDLKLARRYDYLVCLHRAGTGQEFEVWFNTIRERLPVIRVPLEQDIPDVPLDLQAVFDRLYEEGAYLRKIDYTQEPVPPLNAEDAAWADALLRAKGLR